eukprot:1007749-Rhodomonas_salina.3
MALLPRQLDAQNLAELYCSRCVTADPSQLEHGPLAPPNAMACSIAFRVKVGAMLRKCACSGAPWPRPHVAALRPRGRTRRECLLRRSHRGGPPRRLCVHVSPPGGEAFRHSHCRYQAFVTNLNTVGQGELSLRGAHGGYALG